jgi:cyclic pyranopterin phosphate synthase
MGLPAYSLRVSVLEQCQLRCRYCLPGELNPYTRNRSRLRPDEHGRLAALFHERGVTRVRFTGGEPLLREDIADVVAAWRRGAPGVDLALTSNGVLLDERREALIDAGLSRLNVHVDTLRDERAELLMGGGVPSEVLAATLRARERGLEVKLNVVVQRGGNDDELGDFLDWSAETGIQVRFIELMDTGSASDVVQRTFITGQEIVDLIREERAVTDVGRVKASDPATRFEAGDRGSLGRTSVADGVVFGLIASDTQPFCDRCDRLRLSPDGRLRGCLYAPAGVPLGTALRGGASDDEVRAILDGEIATKRSWHPLTQLERPRFSMADVGG